MSRWMETIDREPGRPPVVRAEGANITYEFAPMGGEVSDGLFCPPPRTRLSIRCNRNGDICMRILIARVPR